MDLAENWKDVATWREIALAKRSSADQEKWAEKTRDLPHLTVGQHVMVQNQSGNNPNKWDRRGVIVEKLSLIHI